MLNFTLKQLEVFVRVAECGSFTEAAEQLYLSQSTVSGHIASLEQALGATLLSRNTKMKTSLTPQGREVLASAREIVAQCRTLSGQTAALPNEIIIGASTVPANHLLPGYMADYLHKCPECRFVIKKGDSSAVHEMLLRHEVQLALVGTVLDRQHLFYRPVIEDHLVVITANTEEFRQLQKSEIPGKLLLDRPLIFRETGSGTQRVIDEYLSGSNIDTKSIHVIARIDSPEAILNAVSSGVGISVVSSLAAQTGVASGALLSFELDQPPVLRHIYLAWLKQSHLSPSAEAFAEAILQA